MKNILSQRKLRRNAKTTAVPYTTDNILDSKARQRIRDDFLRGIDGALHGVYLARK